MNQRTRRERSILRYRRRGAVVLPRARSLIDAIRLRQGERRSLAEARLQLLLRHYTVGDGIAYIPYDAAQFPPSGVHVEQIGPSGAGKTNPYWGPDAFAKPVNGAYWLGAELDDGQDDGEHTRDGECTACGPCEANDGGTEMDQTGVPLSCGCCLCEQEDAERAESEEEMGETW